jgi:hypothetical protein
MQSMDRDIDMFRKAAQADQALSWYAIVDSAQHKALPKVITFGSRNLRCLLGAAQDSPLAQQSPHLVELPSPLEISKPWSWISLHAKKKPCVSIMATTKSFEEIFKQLSECIDVMLPDGDAMYLAFWDPAILGTLMGQIDDQTLHVKGPVFSVEQRAKLRSCASRWWYWDRIGEIHSIGPCETVCQPPSGLIALSQRQVDELVEASVPDHVSYYINLNTPHLFAGNTPERRYSLVSHALVRARDLGLTGMRDLVNYVCMELIYKERMHDESIKRILEDVRTGRTEFDTALDQIP